MDVFTFKLSGRLAQWRKYYTNSSSLTYYYPSRTNIIGLLASVLELDYDSYYNLFNSDKLGVAVELNTKLYTNSYILNYRSKKSSAGITQVSEEILFNKNYDINYTLYFCCLDYSIEPYIKKFITKIKNQDFGYGIYLGKRQFKGFLEYIDTLNAQKISNCTSVNGICPMDNISGKLDFENKNKFYSIDTLPVDFDNDRSVKLVKEYIFEMNKNKIQLLDGSISNVYKINNKYICFM